MPLQSSGAISLNDVQNEFGGSNPIGMDEYYGADSGIPSSGTISLNHFYGASAGSWEIIMHTDGYKGAGNNLGNSTRFGNTGTSTFKNITWTSTGAHNRTEIGDGPGLYAAFFYKKNIKQFALISGSGGQNNLQTPSSHSSYHVWDTFTADRDGYTDTGNESLYEIINRLDTYNKNNASWHNNDSVFTGSSIRNFTGGANGYSAGSANAYPNPPTMKTLTPAGIGMFEHTFTNAGATGRTGPTLTQLQNAYSSTSWASDTNKLSLKSNTQGYQLWTVPTTGTYEIEVAGAHGGSWTGSSPAYGGNGGWCKGTVDLSAGVKLVLIVGQQGEDLHQWGGAGGGGGASWVLTENLSTAYAVAGGGGGVNGPAHTSGAAGGDGGSSQGSSSDTYGGAHGNYGNGGGAGFTTNGSGSPWQLGGMTIANGALGGDHTYGGGATGYAQRYPCDGGFGGGGASSWHTGAGGGGYAGGDGVSWSPPGGLGGTTYSTLSGTTYSTHTAAHGYIKIKLTGWTANVPDKFVIWGINHASDNDTQVLAAYSGNLASGKADSWRGNNPAETYWSYWGNDWHSSSSGQTISVGKQTDPGIATNIDSPFYTGPVYLIAYGATSQLPFVHTFTNAGATGRTGPTLTQIQNAYSSTSWASDTSKLNMTTQGYQIWTVPTTATYEFKIRGARGGHTASGRGGYSRYITGRLALKSGDKLTLIVGQEGAVMMGNGNSGSEAGAGGGGSFVIIHTAVDYSSSTIMLAAGGGGGGSGGGGYPNSAGNDVRSDNYSTYQIGTAYLNNGNGGGVYNSNYAGGGGGGWYSDGGAGSAYYDGQGGHGYSNGFTGGEGARYMASPTWFDGTGNGGFGGGGGAWINSEPRPGGGGGYSGGEGASYEQLSNGSGGAGGNYINTSHVTSSSYGAQTTDVHGSIYIEEIAVLPLEYTIGGTFQGGYSSGDSFTITGTQAEHTFTIQAGTTVRFQLYGGAGGRGMWSNNTEYGGPGGYVSVDLAFTSVATIYAYVGQGNISSSGHAGSGGGSTDIRTGKASGSSGSVTDSTFVSNFYSGMGSVLAIAGGGGGAHGGSYGGWGHSSGNSPGSGGPTTSDTNSRGTNDAGYTATGASTSSAGQDGGQSTSVQYTAHGTFGGALAPSSAGISRTTWAPQSSGSYSGYGWPNGGTGSNWATGGGGGGYYGGATNWPNGGGGSNFIYTSSWGLGTITTNSNTVHSTQDTGKLIVTIL